MAWFKKSPVINHLLIYTKDYKFYKLILIFRFQNLYMKIKWYCGTVYKIIVVVVDWISHKLLFPKIIQIYIEAS